MGQGKGSLNDFQQGQIDQISNTGRIKADATDPLTQGVGNFLQETIGVRIDPFAQFNAGIEQERRDFDRIIHDNTIPKWMIKDVKKDFEKKIKRKTEDFTAQQSLASGNTPAGPGLQDNSDGQQSGNFGQLDNIFDFGGFREQVGQELPQSQTFDPFGGGGGQQGAQGQQVAEAAGMPNSGGGKAGGGGNQAGTLPNGQQARTTGRNPGVNINVEGQATPNNNGQQPAGGGGGFGNIGDIANQLPGPFQGGGGALADATQSSALNAINNPQTAEGILDRQRGAITARLNLNNEAAGAARNFGGSANQIQNAMDIGNFFSNANNVANQQNQLAFGNAAGLDQQRFNQGLGTFGAGLDRFNTGVGARGALINQEGNIFDRNRSNAIQDFTLRENLGAARQQQAMAPMQSIFQMLGLGNGSQEAGAALEGFNQSAAQNAAMNPLNQLAGAAGGLGGTALSGKLGGSGAPRLSIPTPIGSTPAGFMPTR